MLSGDEDRSDWVRNILANPAVSLQIGSRTESTTARVVVDRGEDQLARRAVADKYRRRGEVDLDEWEASALPVAVDWSG